MAHSSSRQSLAWLRAAAASSKLFGESRSLSQQPGAARSGSSSSNRRSRSDFEDDVEDDDGTHYMPMATRGNELFVVVDNTIRWADLARLKEQWEEEEREGGQQRRRHKESSSDNNKKDELGSDDQKGGENKRKAPPAYRTLRLKLHERIRQLVVSPNEEIMAVVTEHNVVVVLLPDPAQLQIITTGDDGNSSEAAVEPVRVKTHTIGPTTHVMSQPAVVRALWHPLGVGGNTLVTVTAAAVVRVWELDRRSISSFGEPTLALDLKKLRYARSAQQDDVGAGDMTYNRTFSTDDVEMEVTAACFGAASSGEALAFEWSAATLWLAMAEGDVFALCPLLPSRFQPDDDGTITTLCELKQAQNQSLLEAANNDNDASYGSERARVQAQCAWLDELRDQYEEFESYDGPGRTPDRIYNCPKSQGSIPSLQGPFVIVPNDVQDELTPCDIHVVGATTAAGLVNTLGGSTFADTGDLGTSFSTVCILSTDGRVHVCIDVDGVEPQWLPKKRRLPAYGSRGGSGTGAGDKEKTNTPELLMFEALDTLRPEEAEEGRLPVFTPSTAADEYKFYVTNSKGVYEFSLEPWIHDLEAEIQNSGTEGVRFRTQVLSKGPGTSRERVVRAAATDYSTMATPVLFGTADLGRILLTVQGQTPHALAMLDPDVDEEPATLTWKPGHDLAAAAAARSGGSSSQQMTTDFRLDRDVYVPSAAFSANTEMTTFLERQQAESSSSSSSRQHVHYHQQQRLLKEEIRLSPATLSIITDAHRVLSKETAALNNAVAELFRRCDRLHDEFKHQIRRASELAGRVKEFNDVDDDNDQRQQKLSGGADAGKKAGQAQRKEAVQRRIHEARERNEQLLSRYDGLKRRLAHAGGKPLSSKERAWMAEVKKVQAAAGDAGEDGEENDSDSRKMLLKRYEEVQHISKQLLEQARDMGSNTNGAVINGQDGKIPPDIRKHIMAQMQDMLARESALVDAAMEKLARLGLIGPN